MQISLNIKNKSISKKILDFLASFKEEDIQVRTLQDSNKKENSLSEFSGMWKDRDISIDTIRESAWKK